MKTAPNGHKFISLITACCLNHCHYLSFCRGRGRGRGRGGKGGAKKVVVAPHKFSGVFIARGKDDVLVTLNLVPGKAVYGEKRISVDVRF